MESVTCVSCGKAFDVADDDPLWSITTEVRDDGSEVITGRFIEPPCPSCGKTTKWCRPGVESSGVVTEVTDFDGNVMHANRLDVALDAPYDPDLNATQNIAAAEATP